MNREQTTAFLQEHWCLVTLLVGVAVLIGAILNWNWLCDPTGKDFGYVHICTAMATRSPVPGRKIKDLAWFEKPREKTLKNRKSCARRAK